MPDLLTTSATVFACMSKACAPPPVGRGGSLPSRGGRAFDPKSRTDIALDELSAGMQLRYGSDDLSDIDPAARKRLSSVTDMTVRAKMIANYRITKRLAADPEFQKWFGDHEVTRLSKFDSSPTYAVMAAMRRFMDHAYMKTYYPPESGSSDVLWEMHRNEEFSRTTVGELGKLLSEHVPEFKGMTSSEAVAAMVTRSMIDAWADSASKSEVSFLHQRGAALLHGLGDESMRFLREASGLFGFSGASDPLLRAFARSEYEATQDWFRQQGITEVVLYRGMGYPVRKDSDKRPVTVSEGETVEVVANPLSSWAFQQPSAADFGSSSRVYSTQRVMLKSVVPVELIQSVPLTGAGCFVEAEAVVVGKPSEALVDSADEKYWTTPW